LAYQGEEDDGQSSLHPDRPILTTIYIDTLFRFNCFNTEDGNDPDIGLEYGELSIPGHVLRRDVFDPVISESPLPPIALTNLEWTRSSPRSH
jgi:hypothetical protein